MKEHLDLFKNFEITERTNEILAEMFTDAVMELLLFFLCFTALIFGVIFLVKGVVIYGLALLAAFVIIWISLFSGRR